MRVDTTSIRRALDAWLWRVLPGICVLCSQPSLVAMDLCSHCRAALPWVERACVSCALPLGDPGAVHCNACKAHPPPFGRAVAPLGYVEPVTRMVHRLKFRGNPIDARVLGTLLADAIRAAYTRDALPQLVLPVPLSRVRLLRRGHNQAALLARWVGAELALPVDYRACRRVRNTPPQTGLSRNARLRNLTSAFAAARALPPEPVAIVDDVMTTGSTAAALARVLLAAGASEVHIWAAARTGEPHSMPQALE